MNFVTALNSIHNNIWALLILAAGVFLYHYNATAGASLLTLGAGVFQNNGDQAKKAATVPPTDPPQATK